MQKQAPEAYYLNKKKELEELLITSKQKSKRLAWLRLLIVVFTFLVLYITWNLVAFYIPIIEVTIGILIFLYTVSKDIDEKNTSLNLQQRIDVVSKELNVLQYNFHQYETGEEFQPENHWYAEDLDIFGKASLYQYINRCTSEQGKELLAHRLLYPLQNEHIKHEQEAALELADKPIFRNQFQAYGASSPLTKHAEVSIVSWLESESIYTEPKWRFVAFIFPFFSLGAVILYLTDIIPASLFSLIVFMCMTIAFSFSKKIGIVYDLLSKAIASSDTFYKQLQYIETEIFESKKFIQLYQFINNENSKSASAEIKALNKILNRLNVRLNTLAFFFLNTFLLWDLHQLLALNKWKKENEKNVQAWFKIIAETEVSCTLATLAFNHPHWQMPVINKSFFYFSGENIGHPLLSQKVCVTNSFSVQGTGKIAIVTGSNMGGKSTFLRSMGVNIVLALAGAPVCASQFEVSHIRLMSSMRIADNLAESTSTFYAELKKLKTIIEAVNKDEKVFILLDEILRGTNSIDRHTGSVALLKQFIQKEAVVVIATHDVELASLEKEYPSSIENYHFDVQTAGNELYFDYKLKEGICTSMNASVLMKNIGIEIN